MTIDSNNYYTILGVDDTATTADVEKAYKTKRLVMHPDKVAQLNPNDQVAIQKAQEAFKQLNEAYECLKDPISRSKYDAKPASANAAAGTAAASTVSAAARYASVDETLKSMKEQVDAAKAAREKPCKPWEYPLVGNRGVRRVNIGPGTNDEEEKKIRQMYVNNDVNGMGEYFNKPEVTPLEADWMYETLNWAYTDGKMPFVRMFIERYNLRTDVSVTIGRSSLGEPALNVAAEAGQYEVVKYLVGKKADTNSIGFYTTPLQKAIRGGHLKIAEFLCQFEPKTVFRRTNEKGEIIKEWHILEDTCINPRNLFYGFPNKIEMLKLIADLTGKTFKESMKADLAKAALSSGDFQVLKYLNDRFHIAEVFHNMSKESFIGMLEALANSHSRESLTFLLDNCGLRKTINSNPKFVETLFFGSFGRENYDLRGEELGIRRERLSFVKFLIDGSGIEVPLKELRECLGLEPKNRINRLDPKSKAKYADISMNAYLLSLVCKPEDREFFRTLSVKTENMETETEDPKNVSTHDLIRLANSVDTVRTAGGTIFYKIEKIITARKETEEQLAKMIADDLEIMDDALRFCASRKHFQEYSLFLLSLGADPYSKNMQDKTAFDLAGAHNRGFSDLVQKFQADAKSAEASKD